MRRPPTPHPYRSPSDSLALRIGDLERELRRLVDRIGERSLRRFGEALPARAERLFAGEGDRSQAREIALRQLCDELAAVIARAPALAAELSALPQFIGETALGEPWPADQSELLLAGEWRDRPLSRLHGPAERLARFIGRHDPAARLLTHQGELRAPCFTACSSPFALQARPEWASETVAFELMTPVAQAAGALRLGPMRWWNELATGAGLQHDTHTGDADFDRHFLLQATAQTASRLLTPPVRERLTELGHHAAPELEVRAGLARLRLTCCCDEALLDHGIEILAAIRHAKVPDLLEPR